MALLAGIELATRGLEARLEAYQPLPSRIALQKPRMSRDVNGEESMYVDRRTYAGYHAYR